MKKATPPDLQSEAVLSCEEATSSFETRNGFAVVSKSSHGRSPQPERPREQGLGHSNWSSAPLTAKMNWSASSSCRLATQKTSSFIASPRHVLHPYSDKSAHPAPKREHGDVTLGATISSGEESSMVTPRPRVATIAACPHAGASSQFSLDAAGFGPLPRATIRRCRPPNIAVP